MRNKLPTPPPLLHYNIYIQTHPTLPIPVVSIDILSEDPAQPQNLPLFSAFYPMELVLHLPPNETEHTPRAQRELQQVYDAFEEFFELYRQVYPVL